MAPSPDALTTVDQLKAYLSLSSAEHDALLESLIEAVSAFFNAYCGRNLAARAYSPHPASADHDPANAILDGSGYAELLLPQYPVLELGALTLDGVALAPAAAPGGFGYVLDVSAGVVSLTSGVFSRGRGNVSVTYRAGYAAIPADLAQAALEQSAVRFQESAPGGGRLGVSARTLADGSVSYSASPLLPQVAAVLDRYRNRSLL